MHLRRASIRNIRSIEALTWDVETHAPRPDLAGWHVILGDNGSGKSSMLRAIALALTGPYDAPALRYDWSTWLRQRCDRGEVALALDAHPGWDEPPALEAEKDGDADGGEWGRLLLRVFAFINESGLLPHDTQIAEVTSDDVLFTDGEGHAVSVDELGDGYRSILSLTFELLRNLSADFGWSRMFDVVGAHVVVPGVVLIDEVDAHLHPHWQRRIGHWFVERFPAMQFIVTTHSPLACQAAEHGTIYRLPRPGSQDLGGFVTGHERDRLVYGNILDAYDTPSFGVVPTRSDSGRRKLDRLADLNLKAKRVPLDPTEEAEREHLRTMLPTLARGESIP